MNPYGKFEFVKTHNMNSVQWVPMMAMRVGRKCPCSMLMVLRSEVYFGEKKTVMSVCNVLEVVCCNLALLLACIPCVQVIPFQ